MAEDDKKRIPTIGGKRLLAVIAVLILMGFALALDSLGESDSQIEEVAVGGLITALLVALRGE